MNPMEWFVGEPGRILAVSAVFFVICLAFRVCRGEDRNTRPLLITAIAWAFFAGWEGYCDVKKYNIRVDLFLIYPAIIVLTIYGLISIGILFARPPKQ